MRLFRGAGTAAATTEHPSPVTETYDKSADSETWKQILEGARWTYEQHEKRSETAQKLASVVLAFDATLLTFVLKEISSRPPLWLAITMGIIVTLGLFTALAATLCLVPRGRQNGLPAIASLRELASAHENGRTIPIPNAQFAVDLLNAKSLTETSPLDHAKRVADRRMSWLDRAFVGMAMTLASTLIINFIRVLIDL